jgi:hypothetical protein
MIIRSAMVFPTTLGPTRPRMAPCRARKASALTAVTDLYDVVTFSGLVASMFVVEGL